MFRDDICTIHRPNRVVIEGETVWGEPILIAQNIPCHLSVKAISPAIQSQSTAKVLYDYILFLDTNSDITIKPNDIVDVMTAQGQQYQLRAGESHKYRLTIQTHCEVNKVV